MSDETREYFWLGFSFGLATMGAIVNLVIYFARPLH